MTCAELDRWLDQGMPETDAAAARAHAGTCARCAAALEAALAIETAFSKEGAAARTVPVRAPVGFASSVMMRIGELDAARERQVAGAPSRSWWIRILSDPVATVSITVALLTAALLIWNPAWVFGLTGRLAGHWLTWIANPGVIPLSSSVQLAILATAVPFVIWWVWTIGRQLERALVLQMTRPRT